MPLILLQDITVSYGGPPLLENLTLNLEKHERVCLLGRNGAGKSTLLKLINRELKPDKGKCVFQQDIKIARLDQDVPTQDTDATIYDVVASGFGETGEKLAKYHQLSGACSALSASQLEQMDELQQAIEDNHGWGFAPRIEATLSRLSLPTEEPFVNLSGGIKRRVLLAKALVSDPDILLLDEPTNHLDITAVEVLEDHLQTFSGCILFITHDRAFLQKLATRIVEIDCGQLTVWPGDFELYLRHKQEALEAQSNQERLFDKKLAQEERWIRQGIKARRTRNQGRVRKLEAMREACKKRRKQQGKVQLQAQDSLSTGKVVIEAIDIAHQYQEQALINAFSTTIMRGDKVGIIGANSSGKTTLLKILLQELTPDSGHIKWGTKLEVAYFDQYRAQLDTNKTVMENVADGSDYVETANGRKHIIGYLQDFLFTPERAKTPVKVLSGGERNRLLLAKLFTQPANLLVMDEPTNDLDIETLELLEELLVEFAGTLLVVSHDRALLNNIVTSIIAFEGDGIVKEYVGGYDDWLRQRQTFDVVKTKSGKTATKAIKPKDLEKNSCKLSYKEALELEKLPKKIEALEREISQLQQEMSKPTFYKLELEESANIRDRLIKVEAELQQHYVRWEVLEA